MSSKTKQYHIRIQHSAALLQYAAYFDMQWLSNTAIPKTWNVHNLAASKRIIKIGIPSGIMPSEKLVQAIIIISVLSAS